MTTRPDLGSTVGLVTITGQWWLQPDGVGNVKRTEMCNPGSLGTSDTVAYQTTITSPTRLYFQSLTMQDAWDIVP